MNKLFSLVLFCLIGAVPMDAQQPSIPRDRIDSLFSTWNNSNSPGAALGIISNGELVYEHGYGMADLEGHRKISPTTVFNIASLSKQFTAASILLLQQQKKLSVNDDVRQYIPELPDYGKRISIRQLLDHTSGIRDYIQMMFLVGLRYNSRVKANDALNMITRQKALNFNPGDEMLYSNSGYLLASLIVERVSGKSLDDFERENIFLPLGMKHTGFVNGHASSSIPGLAIGYEPIQGGNFRELSSNWETKGDGGMCTTIEDLLLWDRNFYDPKVGGRSMIEQLLSPASLNDHTLLQYSLGLGVGTYQGLKIVDHGGEWGGYRTEFIRFPDERFSVIVLCNLSSMVPLRLAQQVSEICLGEKMKKVQQEGRSITLSGTMALDSNQLSRFTGFFRNPADELIRQIRVQNGKLLYIRDQGSLSELAPVGSDKFRMMGVPTETEVVFSSAASGRVNGFSVVTPNVKPVIFESFAPIATTPDLLASYCGTYHSDELNADFELRVRDSSLFLKTSDPDDDLLRLTVRDVFKLGSVGIIRLRRNKEDTIEGFSFTFGRVRNLEFKRVNYDLPYRQAILSIQMRMC